MTCTSGRWLTQFRQVFLLLCFCSICVDRVHDQWGLDTHNWTVATVHSLHLPGDQTVCHVTSARTAISFNTKDPKTSDNVPYTFRVMDNRISHLEAVHMRYDVKWFEFLSTFMRMILVLCHWQIWSSLILPWIVGPRTPSSPISFKISRWKSENSEPQI